MIPVPDVTDRRYFERFLTALSPLDPLRLWQSFVQFKRLPSFKVAATASAVYSSQIEGSSVEISEVFDDSRAEVSKFFDHRPGDPAPSWWQPAQIERQRVADLEGAYEFARSHVLNEKNLLKAHGMLSKNIAGMRPRQQGRYRTGRVEIVTGMGEVVYRGLHAQGVPEAMRQLFEGLHELKSARLTVNQSFYHAALLHLLFEKIHPFADGNGRAGRLLEKWFLARHRGSRAWKVPTEEYYRLHLGDYYEGLKIGPTYDELDLSASVPFLTLPVRALEFGRDRAAKQSHERRMNPRSQRETRAYSSAIFPARRSTGT